MAFWPRDKPGTPRCHVPFWKRHRDLFTHLPLPRPHPSLIPPSPGKMTEKLFPDGTLIPPPERKLWLPPPTHTHTHSGALPGEGTEGAFPGRCWPGFMGGIHGLSCREGRTVPLAASQEEPAHRAQRPHWPQGLPDACYPLRWAVSSGRGTGIYNNGSLIM